MFLDPISPGEEFSKASDLQCFETFSDAISFATGGEVQLGPGEVLTPTALEGASASTVIGVDYDGVGYTGATLTSSTTNPNGCFDGSSYGYYVVPGSWNDRISSALAYQGCVNYHYEHSNYGGSSIACDCYSMGVMDNQTSSYFLT